MEALALFATTMRNNITAVNLLKQRVSLSSPTGLGIQMSPPLVSAPVGDQQSVTDRRMEPAVALYCVASNLPRLSTAQTNE